MRTILCHSVDYQFRSTHTLDNTSISLGGCIMLAKDAVVTPQKLRGANLTTVTSKIDRVLDVGAQRSAGNDLTESRVAILKLQSPLNFHEKTLTS